MTDNAAATVSPEAVNEPRCDHLDADKRCRNQGAGRWVVSASYPRRVFVLCEAHKLDLEEQGARISGPAWEPLIPNPVQAVIIDRLARMATGYYG